MIRLASRVVALTSVLALWLVTSASAAQMVAVVAPTPLIAQDVNTWNDPQLSVESFNTSLGVLQSIDLTLNGTLTGDVNWSSTGDIATASYLLDSELSLTRQGA
ncbi:MAG: choice-of-anchor E domain-containing protein, partial [Desulfuromonadales bacterium]|nr:choice-of-anchor E domain-containing protein [Desulfuromonadales bacterium]